MFGIVQEYSRDAVGGSERGGGSNLAGFREWGNQDGGSKYEHQEIVWVGFGGVGVIRCRWPKNMSG